MSKHLLLFCALALGAPVMAQEATCQAAASEKKLAGAAKNAFLKKCEQEATAKCEVAAAEKKLYGAARTNFEKKCVKDAVGE
ncbi:MAG: hypothetical protein ACO214_00220 [Hylemonella sp.]|jgi:hypothetical protein